MNPIYLIDNLEDVIDCNDNPHGMNGTGNNDNSHTIDGNY